MTDTGVGIAPEDQEAVFEEFRQVGTASKKVEGTGLGLAISRKFIELHGGRIWVESQVGQWLDVRLHVATDGRPAPPDQLTSQHVVLWSHSGAKRHSLWCPGTAALERIGMWRRRSACGRVKSADFDLSTSRENTEADVGLVRSYAGTRPVAACRALEKRTLAGFSVRQKPGIRPLPLRQGGASLFCGGRRASTTFRTN